MSEIIKTFPRSRSAFILRSKNSFPLDLIADLLYNNVVKNQTSAKPAR